MRSISDQIYCQVALVSRNSEKPRRLRLAPGAFHPVAAIAQIAAVVSKFFLLSTELKDYPGKQFCPEAEGGILPAAPGYQEEDSCLYFLADQITCT